MALFAYRGRSGAAAVNGEIEADSRPAAVAALRAKGVVATAVEERKAKAAAAAGAAKLGGSVKAKDMAIYTRQFSTMVDAGLPIAQCLQILSEQTESKVLRDVTARIANDVQGGATLAESYGKYPKTFDNLFVNMLAVGESGGVLDVCPAAPVRLHREGRQAEGAGQERDGVSRSPSSAWRASSSSS